MKFTERYSARAGGDMPQRHTGDRSFYVQQGMQPVFFSSDNVKTSNRPQPLLNMHGKAKKKNKTA